MNPKGADTAGPRFFLKKNKTKAFALARALFSGFSIRNDLCTAGNWAPTQVIPEPTNVEDKKASIVITAHVYYSEFVPELLVGLGKLNREILVLISTPSASIADQLSIGLKTLGLQFEIRIVPNVGRNFAPLLVEFGKQVSKYDYFVHIHSKKSTHTKKSIGEIWAQRSYSLFLNDQKLDRSVRVMNSNPSVGLIFADVSDIIRGINFRWGINLRPLIASGLLQSRHIPLPSEDRVDFPAGGMFLARTSAISDLLTFNWEYRQFPSEAGQIDGTLQHAIERAVGHISSFKGFRAVRYSYKLDKFTFESPLFNGTKD